ncbi:MAG: RNA-binding cell elongation regulator Jag/EloR [Elusimicrobiota bacterium]
MKKEIESTGRNVDEAIENGLKQLGLTREEVEIKILDEGKSGLFGLMGSAPSRVKISTKIHPAAENSKEKEKTSAKTEPKISTLAVEILSKMLELAGFVAKMSTENTEAGLVLNVSSEDSAILIGRQGQTMKAVEYLLKLILSKQEGRSVNIMLNINGYLEKRNERIVKKAKELEEQVKMKCEPIEIKLPASERKIIHITLKNSEFVETVSEGEGEDRKLIIRPKNK